MPQGTIVFVHGTGVRLKDYRRGFSQARAAAAAAGLAETFVECAWGDPLGVSFVGKSLPDPASAAKLAEEEADFARWSWLYCDPLFELDQLRIRDPGAARSIPMPGRKPEWLIQWERIAAYRATDEFALLLARGGLADLWPGVWSRIIDGSPIARGAFEASAHELPEASQALARALVAQLHVAAAGAGFAGPDRVLRTALCERLIADWGQRVYGPGAFFATILKRVATRALRTHREAFSDAAVLPVGDILLYQARGEEVRHFIRRKVESAQPPVTLVAHSLGGIACVDLLALPDPPPVARLVTAGSQAPLLYEIGALYSLQAPRPLPAGFPPWLNLYDRNDFLSYIAGRLWPEVADVEIESGQPFPDSHSAYFGNAAAWSAIRRFLQP